MITIPHPAVSVRLPTAWRHPDGVIPDPTDPGDDDPGGWADTFTSRDFTALDTWYAAHTGHNPALDYTTITGNLTITDDWLASNLGNGRATQVAGRWVVERYRVTGSLGVNADNVTLRNCHVDSDGALYGLRSTTNCHGLIAEHCTLAGNGANDNGAALNFSAARTPGQITIRFCDISGFRAGLYCFGGVHAEYCWVHDLHFSEGSHNTGASLRAGNNTLRRNLITDGNSAAISWYPEYGPYTGNLAIENALRLPESDTGPEVILAASRAYSTPEPGDTRRLVDNLFYRGGSGGGGIGGMLTGFTTIAGNHNRFGNPVG
ncbi:MAG: hypothetical protein QM628_00195 [Propionicimonas sp.]